MYMLALFADLHKVELLGFSMSVFYVLSDSFFSVSVYIVCYLLFFSYTCYS